MHEFGIVEVGGVVLRMCSECGLTHILRAESAVWKEVINNEIPPCDRPVDLEVVGKGIKSSYGFGTR